MNHLPLAALLDQGLGFAPEYRNGLSNHLPMALVALAGLGASPQRLQDFAAKYSLRLAPLPAAAAAPADGPLPDWLARRGDVAAYPALRAFFGAWLQREGAATVLRAALPHLMPGVGAAAFHGLLRTSYAVDSGHAGELAAGLAYWTCRHLPLADLPPGPTEASVDPWARRLHRDVGRPAGARDLIFQLMADAAAQPGFAAAAGTLRPGPTTLRELTELASRCYLASRDFTVLHLVTSCHGLRLLMPCLADPDAALRAYALAFGAALLASGVDPARPAPAIAALAWDELSARACDSDNDHTIKLVYTCLRQAQSCSDDSFRLIATLALSA